MNDPTSARPLDHLHRLDAGAIEAWLQRALRGRERLPLVTPDEHPFLAIARHESSLDEIRRKDVRTALGRLVARYASEGDGDSDYVTSLLGLVEELDLQSATLPLGQLALDDQRFDALPPKQQARVLGTIIDMRVVLRDERWSKWAEEGRHQALALGALLSKSFDGLDLLPALEADEGVADSLYLVLSEHWRALDTAGDRRRMRERGREVCERCSEPVRSAVRDWLAEIEEGSRADVSTRSRAGAALMR